MRILLKVARIQVHPARVRAIIFFARHCRSFGAVATIKIRIFDDLPMMAKAAADHAAEVIQQALGERGQARIIAATGISQIEFLRELTARRDIDWAAVEMFHLDEYIGLPVDHPASFCRFLRDRLIAKTGIKKFHLLEAESGPDRVIATVGSALKSAPIDVAFVGIGKNCHLAFNDPPADFETEQPYLVVNLDFACRMQQVEEGWFADVGQVPMQAISMSVRQILRSKEIMALVPGSRKALAVKVCLEHGISPTAPASILRTHGNTTMYLDRDSAAQLSPETGQRAS
jgi:glucosamine-6-phosphate deaminase